MIGIAAILFVATALGGATMFAIRSRGGNPPLVLAFVHGAAAVTSVVLLAIGTVAQRFPVLPLVALGFFVLAAPVGLHMLSHHRRGLPIPYGALLLHAAVAVCGLTTLLVHVLG